MKIEQAVALLNRLTFRPGWTIDASWEPVSGVVNLTIGQPEVDVEERDPNMPIVSIKYTSSASRASVEAADEATVLRWALDVLSARLLHEIEEWLRLDGQPLVEPHPEKGWLRGILGAGRSTDLPRMEAPKHHD